MDAKQNAAQDLPPSGASIGDKPSLDPLRRMFVPIERRTSKGTLVFKTMDGDLYARLDDGSIRRAHRKINGNAARRARARARRS